MQYVICLVLARMFSKQPFLSFTQAVIRRFWQRCHDDRITISAGHLAYVTLLSLVPLLMVVFTILSAFPAFATFRQGIENFIFDNFVPTAGGQIQSYLTTFIDNASGMGTVGIVSLLAVALLLISNIDKALNHIWQTTHQRPMIITLAIYWMVISMGPIFVGASLAISSYIISLAVAADEYTLGASSKLLSLLPFVFSWLGFLMLYMLVPKTKVYFRDAAIGALFAAVLFEVSKFTFQFYITNFPSYQVIYGAIAAIPILFLWIYLVWIVVLLGAQMTCALQETTQKLDC